MHPTTELYSSLQIAYEHFNKTLFDSQLEEVIFTVQRQKGIMGYFAPERWGNLKGTKCHEIAINPSYIANARLIEVMQTLVHEMVHCWQHCFGTPSRANYHNKEWALKMIDIGLMPSTTGEPGGKTTGQQMGDYIIEEGEFLKSFNLLKKKKKFQLQWIDRKSLPRLFEPVIANPNQSDNVSIANNSEGSESKGSELAPHKLKVEGVSFSEMLPSNFVVEEKPKKPTRIRYICNGCGTKVYGKTGLNIRCEDCDLLFEL